MLNQPPRLLQTRQCAAEGGVGTLWCKLHSRTSDRTRRSMIGMLAALAVLVISSAASAEILTFVFSDPVGDSTISVTGESIDVVSLTVTFDNQTGAYESLVVADSALPFIGYFRLNLNLMNGDVSPFLSNPAFFFDNVNDLTLASPTTEVLLFRSKF